MIEIVPEITVDLRLQSSIRLALGVWDAIFYGRAIPVEATPIRFKVWIDPMSPRRYCYGLDWYTEAS